MDILSNHTNFIVVPPATPNDAALVKKISRLLADNALIREAHLPCVIEFGQTTESKPTLFVVVDSLCDRQLLHKELNQKINGGFFKKKSIDIRIVMDDFPLLESIRETNCLIGWRD